MAFIKTLSKNKKFRYFFTFMAVILSGFMQACIIQIFIKPINLLPSGFTGVAILIEKISTNFLEFSFSTSFAMLALNVPIAILCSKTISKRFTFFSLLQVFSSSFFLRTLNFSTLFDDILLNIIFGGFLYGIMVVISLKANASTGGTDFIALFVSNKINKSIFNYIFIFNSIILLFFGILFNWENAGYSILFQFISTKTIETFYNRYVNITLQITTSKADEVIDGLIKNYRHGISRVDGVGGYSSKSISLLHTVVSGYEEQEIVRLIKSIDKHVVINTFKTKTFYGSFYLKPIE
ncbi:MAG: YitT family protein [Breznakia sp.]